MRFNYSGYLVLLIFVPGLVLFYIYIFKQKKRLLSKFGDFVLVQKLINPDGLRRQKIKTLLLVASLFFIVIGLSGPQIGTRMIEIKRRGIDIIIAIDCSASMLAEDIKPNRMERAKYELSSFIDRLHGDRIGIIAFAGTAFLQCPLTLDYGAAKMFLNIIDTNLIPQPGTSIGSAIKLAMKSFEHKERKYKALIILTDGEDHDKNTPDIVDEAVKEGIRIYTIGFGNPEGELIPIRDNQGNLIGYKKDKKGEPVLSKLDEMLLQKIALVTGGKYYRSTSGEIELERIYDDISGMEKKLLQSKYQSLYEDRFQYFIFIAIILLIIEFILTEIKAEKTTQM